ncbi:hypothetical protein BC567DRAFT_48785 [Phyllosticta citribraziliensis]
MCPASLTREADAHNLEHEAFAVGNQDESLPQPRPSPSRSRTSAAVLYLAHLYPHDKLLFSSKHSLDKHLGACEPNFSANWVTRSSQLALSVSRLRPFVTVHSLAYFPRLGDDNRTHGILRLCESGPECSLFPTLSDAYVLLVSCLLQRIKLPNCSAFYHRVRNDSFHHGMFQIMLLKATHLKFEERQSSLCHGSPILDAQAPDVIRAGQRVSHVRFRHAHLTIRRRQCSSQPK